jgi:hypothetical protein
MQVLLPSLSFIKKTIIPHCLRFCTLLIFISFLGIQGVKGQLVKWTMTSNGTSWATSPFSPTFTSSNLIVNTALTRGSGLGTSGSSADYSFGGSGANQTSSSNAITNSNFFIVSLSANSGYVMSITGIPTWFTRKSGTSTIMSVLVQYKINNGSYTDIGTINITSTSSGGSSTPLLFPANIQTALSNLPSTSTVTLRFVVISSTSANVYLITGNSTNFSDRLIIDGSVTASSSTVTFNANGGSGNMANQTSSAAANLTSNSFTRTCYAFTGWNTAANGTGTAYADGANYPFTSSTTLYAQWKSQNQWTGSANNNWNNAGNWSCGNVPSATENVLINMGSPALDINYEVPATYTLTLSGTGSLTINPGNKLTITGAADFGNKLVTVAANASNTGAIVLNGGSLQNATNVALQQWFTAQRAWRMLSNPFTTSITGTSIASDNSGFSVNQSGTGDIVVYNSANDSWSANTTIAANTCYGFFFKGLQSDFTGTPGLSNYSGAGPTASVFSVKGTLNTGSVTITPSNASPAYTLVGNPFAAPVNSIALTGGVAAPYYYYQANAASTDSKVKSGAWIAASSNSSNTTTIPMMGLIAYQAPSATSFTIPIAAINTAGTAVSALFKTTAAATQLNIDLMKNNILFDRCIVREDIDVLAQSLDQKDLLKMENVTANVYALTPANDRLAVYTEPAFTQAIPLAISAPVGTYQFNIQNTMNTSADWYLIDNYTHQQQLLANNSTYTFDITNDVSSKGNKRFELSKQAWTTSVGPASNQDPIQLLGNLVQDYIALQLDANIRQASYQLLDIRGAVLAQGTLMAGKQEIAMASFVSGMYLLHIQNDQQHTVYKITKY